MVFRMTLNEYLRSRHETSAEFANRVGASTVAVSRWRQGVRYPSPRFMRKIMSATENIVRPEDFMPEEEVTQ